MYDAVIQSMERPLRALAKLYEEYSECARNHQSEIVPLELSAPDPPLQISFLLDSYKVVMELEVNGDIKDVDIITAGVKVATSISFSAVKWKLGMTNLISSFFSVLHVATWDILLNLMEKECDTKLDTSRKDKCMNFC